ncbi:Tm-1-like ATP-binding domain-containing protein [uncultured Kriegella sp.]|uniref:Tm-1-like ATP-binding domain-containing protein n=1 Tax=uncultured Kriegella sp. TaxID=1798910 RepID=UPI0030DB6DF4|tara:strand:+ start:82292 stop:83536 length:1245 start_codon:yes stop_codon:yes gene_type:complete
MDVEPITHNSKNRQIVMIGCFDTKGEDFSYLYTSLGQKGAEIVSINTGVFGSTELFPITYEADVVAEAAGTEISILREQKDRGVAIEKMGEGAAMIIAELLSENRIDGIIGMGGGGGTFIALKAMKALPFGIPKLCLSTLATKDLSTHIGSKDITLMPSVVDVAGLNSISRVLISQAAGAICAMADTDITEVKHSAGSIAVSVFGNTTLCVDKCSELLKSQGYEVMAFHSVGVGGMTMEALARDNCFDAILDITTTELADELCGGICSAGPERLTAGSQKGLPQVVVPGCLDMVNFGALDTVPKKYKNRQLYSWAPDVTLMRTNKEENKILGELIAEKLNMSSAPVAILLPLGGLSKIGGIDEVFYNPEIDRVLFDAIKNNVNPSISVIEVPENINTIAFANKATGVLLDIIKK